MSTEECVISDSHRITIDSRIVTGRGIHIFISVSYYITLGMIGYFRADSDIVI